MDAIRQGLSDGLRDVAQFAVNQGNDVIRDEAFDEGTLHRSGTVREVDPFQFQAAWTAEHSIYVHFGAGPAIGNDRFMPPLEPIQEWAKRTFGVTGDDAKEAAEAVRWKIWQDGLEPVPYAQIGAQRAGEKAEQIIRQRIQDRLREVGGSL